MTEELFDLGEALRDLGVSADEVAEAEAAGTLELLAISSIVTLEEPLYDIDEVARLSGVSSEQIRAYWRALGFPDPRPGEILFTEPDVEMLRSVLSFIVDGSLEPELALQMSRVVGSAMDRVAVAQIDALEVRREGGDGPRSTMRADSVRGSAELLSLMPQIMDFVWRRQLASAARRRMMRVSATGGNEGVLIGFADLVGFTAHTAQLDEHELADVVGRFESVAYDVVSAHNGRVVKMIGDEVLFLHEDVREGAALALDLAERFRDDEDLSDVRVGLASGSVLERDGDVYGQVVNLASRVVTVAYPGSVVVSEEVHDALTGDADLLLRSLRSHYLKDIGRVPLWTLRRSGDAGEQPYRRARARMAAREFLRDRWEEMRRDTDFLPSDLPGIVRRELDQRRDSDEVHDHSTGQFEALTDAVLEADLDPDTQIKLLADLEAERRLRKLEDEAQDRAAEADLEAERRLEEIEQDARRRVTEIEREARRKIDHVLEEAEAHSRKVNEEASRKVQKVAVDAEKKADRATKEAKAEAEKTAKRRARKRTEDDKKR